MQYIYFTILYLAFLPRTTAIITAIFQFLTVIINYYKFYKIMICKVNCG
jgi:hypothetical protein